MNVLGKIQKSTKHFSVPIEKKVINTDKDGNESVVTIFYKIKFIDCVKIVFVFLNMSVHNNLIKYKCLSCNKDYSNKLDEKLQKQFKNTFKFLDNDFNKFILLLRKGVYSNEYMDEREKFNETTLPEKKRRIS